MRFYIGMDDTDTLDCGRGTGKLARWFESELPEGCRMWGVARQQLLVHELVPFTSHNSAACIVVDAPGPDLRGPLTEAAAAHMGRHFVEGSDPGLCVAMAGDAGLEDLMAFGSLCTHTVVGQDDAMRAARAVHLSAHGGTSDGIIGAAACVGLTAHGWAGRFIEFGGLRQVPERVTVEELAAMGILVASLDRDARVPAPGDVVLTNNWCRPRLWGGRAVLMVDPEADGLWRNKGAKRGHGKAGKPGVQGPALSRPPRPGGRISAADSPR